MSRDYKASDVQPDARFPNAGHAASEGYNTYEVVLFPIDPRGWHASTQRTLFYAVSDHVAVLHCQETCGQLSYRLYRLTLLSLNGRTE